MSLLPSDQIGETAYVTATCIEVPFPGLLLTTVADCIKQSWISGQFQVSFHIDTGPPHRSAQHVSGCLKQLCFFSADTRKVGDVSDADSYRRPRRLQILDQRGPCWRKDIE